jgi:LacI family transcriptional regulator
MAALVDARQPVVVVQDQPPRSLPDAASIRQDDAAGGRLIAERLIARGARRLLLLVPRQQWPAMVERERGVAAAVARHAGAALAVVRSASEGIEDTQAALASWVEPNGLPDAVLGGNDQMGIAALLWLQEQGRDVPGDVKVTGFNGFAFRRYVRPTLTSVHSPALALGERAGALLLERIETGAFTAAEVVMPVELLPGKSD